MVEFDTLNEAAELVRRAYKQKQALEAVGEILREVRDFEAFRREAETRAKEALEAREKAFHARDEALADQARAVEILQQVKQDAETVRLEAERFAADELERARAKEAEIHSVAQASADAFLAQARRDEAAIRKRVDTLTSEEKSLRATLQELRTKLDELRERFS